MAETSIFPDKVAKPGHRELKAALGKLYRSWQQIADYAVANGPGTEEWHYSKAGWNCRIKGKRSVVVYMMPCNGYFRASFVLGANATIQALESELSAGIKKLISDAKVFAEGRGFSVEVKSDNTARDIKMLIDIKCPAR